jgi:hypothetical protein
MAHARWKSSIASTGESTVMTNIYGYAYERKGFWDSWGHLSPQLLKTGIAVSILLGVRSGPPTLLSVIASFALIGFVIITWLLMRKHDRTLCESCARSIPLNAAEQSARYRRRFATAHAGGNLKLVIAYLAVLLGSNYLLTVPHGRWVWAAIQASMIYLISAHSTHRRLQPWCPWCSDGGGGSEFDDATPDLPRDPGRRQLV